jgi:hypothetical protein
MSFSLPSVTGAFLLLSLSSACSCPQPVAPEKPAAAEPQELSCLEFRRGQHSGIRKQQVRLVRTKAEWLTLWREHSSLQLPGPELPQIDFESQMLIAVFLGERPTSGFGVQVQRVRAMAAVQGKAPQLEVTAHETRPDPDTPQAQVITSPFHMLLAPRTEGVAQLQME